MPSHRRPDHARIADAIITLLSKRRPTSSICPSEVARVVASDDDTWRALMPLVRDVAVTLRDQRRVLITRGGVELGDDIEGGAIRFSRGNAFDTWKESGHVDYEITTDQTRMNVNDVHAFLATTYWSEGISRALVERAMRHSICVGVLHAGRQIGFARVVSDRTNFAYLADVFVVKEHRGRGLSRQMLQALMDHPDLQSLRRWMLHTRDAHGLYAKLGFTPLASPDRVMERHRPDVYTSR